MEGSESEEKENLVNKSKQRVEPQPAAAGPEQLGPICTTGVSSWGCSSWIASSPSQTQAGDRASAHTIVSHLDFDTPSDVLFPTKIRVLQFPSLWHLGVTHVQEFPNLRFPMAPRPRTLHLRLAFKEAAFSPVITLKLGRTAQFPEDTFPQHARPPPSLKLA